MNSNSFFFTTLTDVYLLFTVKFDMAIYIYIVLTALYCAGVYCFSLKLYYFPGVA